MARTRSAATIQRPAVPRHPRRVSGPVARPRPVPVPGQPRPRTPVAQPHDTFGATLRALPDHRLLDTLLRSRAWIWLLGMALGGIVFMQVSLLGMNSGIGRNVARSTELQHANAELQDAIAQASNGGRVQAFADSHGLIAPSPTDVDYLRAGRGGDAARAVSRMTPPSDSARAALASGGRTAAATTTAAAAPAATAAPVATASPVATATATPAPVATAAPTAAPVATTAPASTAPVTSAAAVTGGTTP